MNIWNVIGLIFTLTAFIAVMYVLNKSQYIKKERAQDLFQFKKIFDDGLIELHNGKYRRMLEVEPINMYLKTPEEQELIWMQFRNMLNAISIPITILVQSRHKDIKPYVAELRDSASNLPTAPLVKYGLELAEYLENEVTEEQIKDHRYYIILEADPNIKEGNIDIPNETVSKLVRSFQKPLSKEEAEDVARQELADHINIIASFLSGIGLNVYTMDKNAVLEMSYSALNRDLAPVADYEGIVLSSSIYTSSLTKEVINQSEENKNGIKEERENAFSQKQEEYSEAKEKISG